MPPPRMPSEKTVATLRALPLADILTLLDALSTGDLAAAAQAGGGVPPVQLAALLPDGDTGALLDSLEKRALFQLLRQTGLALMRALPGAVITLAAISEGTALGDAEPMCEENDKHAQALRLVQAQMRPKVIEQRRIAALALFTLAQDLGILALAKEFREPDRQADEEVEIRRMAEAQGIDYLPPLRLPEELKSRVQ